MKQHSRHLQAVMFLAGLTGYTLCIAAVDAAPPGGVVPSATRPRVAAVSGDEQRSLIEEDWLQSLVEPLTTQSDAAGAVDGQPAPGGDAKRPDGHDFTIEEIKAMSTEEYEANEAGTGTIFLQRRDVGGQAVPQWYNVRRDGEGWRIVQPLLDDPGPVGRVHGLGLDDDAVEVHGEIEARHSHGMIFGSNQDGNRFVRHEHGAHPEVEEPARPLAASGPTVEDRHPGGAGVLQNLVHLGERVAAVDDERLVELQRQLGGHVVGRQPGRERHALGLAAAFARLAQLQVGAEGAALEQHGRVGAAARTRASSPGPYSTGIPPKRRTASLGVAGRRERPRRSRQRETVE